MPGVPLTATPTSLDSIHSFSRLASGLPESATHGTKAMVDRINSVDPGAILDLGIGALDQPTDPRIAAAIGEVAREEPALLHDFAPVRGHLAVREAIGARLHRLHRITADPEQEILVTPGGVKGALAVTLATILNPGDRVIVPVPNWPHYADMIRLHGGVPVPVLSADGPFGALTQTDLEDHLDETIRAVVLGDCINPTGKVYSNPDLAGLGSVLAHHNSQSVAAGRPGSYVIFDCPYEAHVPEPRPRHFFEAVIEPEEDRRLLREFTIYLSGPGKTYGMHGDRVGYMVAAPPIVDVAARVQANTNSFASTYAQVACRRALQADMDEVANRRAEAGRASRQSVRARLSGLECVRVAEPDAGYFLFVDFSDLSERYSRQGCTSAADFLREHAGIASIGGRSFAAGEPGFGHFARLNCGRSPEILDEACDRLTQAIERLH